MSAPGGTWRRLLGHGPGMAGVALLLLVVLACTLGRCSRPTA